MENDSLLKALLLVSILLLLIAIGWTWLEIRDYWQPPPGGTASEPRRYRFAVPMALGPGPHRFRLQQVDFDGTPHVTEPVRLVVQPQAAVTLSAPAPNPASGPVRISFSAREAEQTALHLYNALGKRVATLYQGDPPARGRQTVRLNAAALPSGPYFLRLTTDGRTRTRTLTVVR